MNGSAPAPSDASKYPEPTDSSRLSNTDRVLLALTASAILVSNGVWAWYLVEYGVDIPRMDQINTPGAQIVASAKGELNFSMLIQQHNESRKLLPNLISLSLYHLRGFWDLRAELLMGWLIGVACVAGIARLSWLTTRRIVTTAILTAFFSGLLWSSHTFYFHFFSVTFERYLPQLLLLLVLISFLRYGVRWSTIVFASLASSMAQFSYASGVVVWPLVLGFIVLSEPRAAARNAPKIIFFLLSAVPSFWLFFNDYIRPDHHTALIEILNASPSDMFMYLLHFLGNGFTSKSDRIAAFGAFFLGMYLLLVARTFLSRKEDPQWKERVAWIVVGGYSLAQAVLSMIGRLPMGIGHAQRLDYVAHPLYLITAVLALTLLALAPQARRRMQIISLAFILGLTWMAVKPALRDKMIDLQSELQHARSCFLLLNYGQQPDCLKSIYWDNDWQVPLIRKISPYLKRPILESLAFGSESDPHDVIWDTTGDSDIATGLARIDEKPADAVVALSHTGNSHDVVLIERVGFTRSDSTGKVEKLIDSAGWVMKLDRPTISDPCALRLYAMRNDTGRLHEIVGATSPRCDPDLEEP